VIEHSNERPLDSESATAELPGSTGRDRSGSGPAGAADRRARAEEVSRLFREHNRALVSFVRTRIGNEQEAKEVAQEAYVRLLQLDGPVAVSYLRWYLFKIARHIATDRYRQQNTRARLDQLDGFAALDLGSPTESGVMAADELAKLLAALRELPVKCQKAFLLHKVRGLSTLEVAKHMGITDRMVRNHIRRALAYCGLRCEGMGMDEALKRVGS
jgi:RNA polymerase sigma-70 factor (ECF subfamily)